LARCQWLIPVILATEEAEIKKIQFKASPGKKFERPYLKKAFTKIGLVKWLKVKALSSSPSTEKKKKKRLCYCGIG
jgi:hypothetical protein